MVTPLLHSFVDVREASGSRPPVKVVTDQCWVGGSSAVGITVLSFPFV